MPTQTKKKSRKQPELGAVIIGDTELLAEKLDLIWAESIVEKARREGEPNGHTQDN